MSAVSQKYYREKLRRLLSIAEDEKVLHTIWAIDRVQSKYDVPEAAIAWFRDLPRGAVTSELVSNLFIHKWRLERLANETLHSTKDFSPRNGKNRELNYRSFNALATVMNVINDLENAFSGRVLDKVDILEFMPRIAHQQFEWQRGFLNAPLFYRSAYIYSGEKCLEYFENKYGVTLNQFSLAGFAAFSHLCKAPVLPVPVTHSGLGLTQDAIDRSLQRICLPHDQARRIVRELRAGRSVEAYHKSLLRQYPLIMFSGARIRAPLCDLILERITSGVFYDLIGAGGVARDEAGHRFEKYCVDLLASTLLNFDVSGSYKYDFRGNEVASPDIMIRLDDELLFCLECKANRMSFEAKFSDDPMTSAKRAFDEIVNGVCQIWRFFSRARRLKIYQGNIRSDAMGVILTMDPWLVLSLQRYDKIMTLAREKISSEAEVAPEDCRPISFCDIEDMERLLSKATEESFSRTIRAATSGGSAGWLLSGLHDRESPGVNQQRGYPFHDRLGEVLPWWNWIEDVAERRAN